jgi:hypothetical protein
MTRLSLSGSYFTNLMSTGFYSMDCGDDDGQPSQNYDELDDTQPHGEPTVQKDGPATEKEKKRTKIFSVNEDKVLVSGWLNVSIDPIHETNQALAHIGREFTSTSMRIRSTSMKPIKHLEHIAINIVIDL